MVHHGNQAHHRVASIQLAETGPRCGVDSGEYAVVLKRGVHNRPQLVIYFCRCILENGANVPVQLSRGQVFRNK